MQGRAHLLPTFQDDDLVPNEPSFRIKYFLISLITGVLFFLQIVLYRILDYNQKVMQQEVPGFKAFLKLSLLQAYKENNNFDDLMHNLTSNTVNEYSWIPQSEKIRLQEGLQYIEELNQIPPQYIPQYELYKIRQVIPGLGEIPNQDGYVQVILAKKKEAKREDFINIGLSDKEFSLLERRLLSNKEFKGWCSTYAKENALPPSLPFMADNLINGMGDVGMKQLQQHRPADSFLEDLHFELDISAKPKLTAECQKERKVKWLKYLELKINYIEKEYGKSILETLFLKEQYKLLKDTSYEVNFHAIKKALQEDGKLQHGSKILQRINIYQEQKTDIIRLDSDMRTLNQLFAPIDTFSLKKAKENTLPKIKCGLAVIGYTDVGKSTFILALLGYKYQEKITRSKNKILTTVQRLSPQHQALAAANTLSSVTQNLSAYRFFHNNLEVYLIDTPGFSDTNGEQMDISNQILIEKAYESCDAICYLYLVDITSLSGRAIILISFAKDIAQRFAYHTEEELSSMLLIVFNIKGDIEGNIYITNLPIAAQELVKEKYHLNKKQKIALSLISQRLRYRLGWFRPLQNVENIKSDITKLKFQKKHRILRKFDPNFEQKVILYNEILYNGIKFNLNAQRGDNARFYYDQLCILESTVGQQSTQTKKKICYEQIKSDVTEKQQRIRIILREKVQTLTATTEQLKSLTNLLTSAKLFIHILSLTTIMEAINSEKNKAFENILKLINLEATNQQIHSIIQICVFFFGCAGLKEKLNKSPKDIEHKCFEYLRNIPHQIEHQYKAKSYEQFDKNFKSYITFYKFYFSFSQKFPQQFQKLRQFKEPDQLKLIYTNKQSQKVQIFVTSIQRINKDFISNSPIKDEDMDKLNASQRNVLYFARSEYISLLKKVQLEEDQMRVKIGEQCAIFTLHFQKTLLFEEAWTNNIGSIRTMMANMQLIKKKVTIQSVKDVVSSSHTAIINTLQKQFAEFQQQLNDAHANMNNLQIKTEYKLLSNIKEKLLLFLIFEISRKNRIVQKWSQLKEQILLFCNQIELCLRKEYKNYRSDAGKNIFQRIKSLKRYQNIESDVDDRIKKIRQMNENNLRVYLQHLKQAITIKEIRSHSDYKLFNHSYIKAMNNYIEVILLNTYEEGDISPIHEEIYITNANSLTNIDTEIDLCLELGREADNFSPKEDEGDLMLKLWSNYHYISVLGEIYDHLKKITDKFYKYIKDQIYLPQRSAPIEVQEMTSKIQGLFESRYRIIHSFVTPIANTIRNATGGSIIRLNAQRYNLISNYLQELQKLKTLFTKIIQNSDRDINISLEHFQKLEEELYTFVALYNNKQLNRIEKAINIDNITILSMHECQILYEELKSSTADRGENINQFISRLENFFHRSIEKYERTLDSCVEPLETENVKNFKQAMHHYLSFSNFIPPQDAANITFFDRLASFIENVWIQFKQAIDIQLINQEQKVEQRNFESIDRELSQIRKICMKMQEYLREKKKRNLSAYQNVDYQQQAINKIIERVQNIMSMRKSQAQSDRTIAERPLEGQNRYRLQEVFSNLKKGQQKNRVKEKIQNDFTGLLSKYQLCKYSESSRLGKEITDLLHYIPYQLSNSFNFKARYEELRKSKLAKERVQLDKLKQQRGTAGLNALIHKHSQYAVSNSFEMKQETFEIIKNEVDAVAAQIAAEQGIKTKIKLAKDKFWILKYKTIISQAEYFTADMENLLIVTEHQIFEGIEKIVSRELQQLRNIINQGNPVAVNTALILQSVGNIHYFCVVFAERGQIVHENKKYEQLLRRIKTNIADWEKNFDIVCRMGQFWDAITAKELSKDKIKKLMRKCSIKSVIYSIIFRLFAEQHSQEREEQIIQEPNQQQMNEIEEGLHQGSLILKIQQFRKKVHEHIRNLQSQLLAIQFQNYISLLKYEIDKVLLQADRSAALLELYEHNFTCFKEDHDQVQPKTQEVISAVQNNLNRLLTKFLGNLNESFFNLYKEVPSELYFLEILFEKIAGSAYRTLFRNSINVDEGQMAEKIDYSRYLSNPTKEFNMFIDDCIARLKPELDRARSEFIRIEQLKKQQNEQLSEMERKMTEENNTIYTRFKQKQQDLVKLNQGKSEEEKEAKLMEAKQLYELDLKTIQDKWNERNMKLRNKFANQIAAIVKNYACMMLNLKKLQINFKPQNAANSKLAELLKAEIYQVKRAKLVRVLADALQEYNVNNYAQMLKDDSPYFRFLQFVEFNRKTAKQDIHYVIEQMFNMVQNNNSTPREKENFKRVKKQLETEYKEFNMHYFGLLKQHAQESIENRIEIIICQYREASRVQRLAIILAVWSLEEKSKNIDEDIQLNNEEGESMDINPHPVQIAALLLLTKTQDEFKSQLAQILTGQGKSIVLATLAIFIAKSDTPVVVSCYSSYLCVRDSKAFQYLFFKFKVTQLITYNTFNEICEKALNNPQYSTEQRILEAITQGASKEERMGIESQGRKPILLIDEGDVFFEKAYFGNTFCPVLKLNDPDSREFIKYVFEELEKNKNVAVADLAQSKQFGKVLARYPRIEHILRNQLHRMKSEFGQPQNEYFVEQLKIMYKDKDSLSEKRHFGYETVFAYCREFRRGRVSQEHYEKAIFIPLIYGEFSYAELPNSYSAIIGLSGTILNLPNEKLNHLQEKYGINRRNMYILPSIYGNEFQRKELFSIQNDATYYKEIVKRIREEVGKGRPVLVCFRDYAELMKFYNHETFKKSQLQCVRLHEQLDNELRDRCIMGVGAPQRVTVMTAEFTRGTDFVASDRNVQNNGGLHIILTYVPQLMSELVQLKGRTGRQGQNGSIHAIISQSEARQKNIVCEDIQNIDENMISYMKAAGQKEEAQVKLKLQECLKNHLKTQKFLESLNHSAVQYIQFLFTLNRVQVTRETPTKIIIGIDGTSSMEKTFELLIRQVNLIMSRIVELKKSESINGSFIVQTVVYRNYNSGDKVIVASEFHEDLEKLGPFLEQIVCEGGKGNEAIEMLYRHINIQKDVDMLILIGDAPPNTEAQVRKNRKDEGWEKFMRRRQGRDPLYQLTDSKAQENRFSPNIIINGLYIPDNKYVAKDSAKTYFNDIAQRHGGEARQFDFSKQHYSEVLVKFFTTKILAAINSNLNQQQINEAYSERWQRFIGYTS